MPFKLVIVLAWFPITSSWNTACYIRGLIHGIGRGVPNASVQDTEDEQVILFDSSQGFSPRLSRSLKTHLFAIYGRGKRRLPVVHPRVQQQHSGHSDVDCGIFAIAYATEFVFNQYTGNELIEFDRSAMREKNLVKMFE